MQKLMRTFVYFLVSTTFSYEVLADSSHPVCSSVAACEQLQEKVNEQIEALTSAGPTLFLDIEKDTNGEPLLLTQSDAIAFCAKKNAHLPSVLEITEFASLCL